MKEINPTSSAVSRTSHLLELLNCLRPVVFEEPRRRARLFYGPIGFPHASDSGFFFGPTVPYR